MQVVAWQSIKIARLAAASGLTQSDIAAPFMIAASPAPDRPARRHFNGRIDSPRLWSRPLAVSEMRELLDVGSAHPAYGDLLAAWEFSIGIPTDCITDVSPHRLHGRLDLAETLLRKQKGAITSEWCTGFAADYHMDINVYRGQELVATRRLAAARTLRRTCIHCGTRGLSGRCRACAHGRGARSCCPYSRYGHPRGPPLESTSVCS